MTALTDDRRFVDLDDADAALELLSQAVFASGMGMPVVESKWDGIRDAFHGFRVDRVADLDEQDVDRLVTDPRVIRNRRKLVAVIENARTLRDDGGLGRRLRALTPDERTAELTRAFRFVGPTGSEHVLYWAGLAGSARPACDRSGGDR